MGLHGQQLLVFIAFDLTTMTPIFCDTSYGTCPSFVAVITKSPLHPSEIDSVWLAVLSLSSSPIQVAVSSLITRQKGTGRQRQTDRQSDCRAQLFSLIISSSDYILRFSWSSAQKQRSSSCLTHLQVFSNIHRHFWKARLLLLKSHFKYRLKTPWN